MELFIESDITGVSIDEQGSNGEITFDKGVVTASDDADLNNFAKSFIEAIAMHRHWDRESKEHVPA